MYSCACYREEDDSLETAQVQKLDPILDKLMLKPGCKAENSGANALPRTREHLYDR
jgi:hypothetical protein